MGQLTHARAIVVLHVLWEEVLPHPLKRLGRPDQSYNSKIVFIPVWEGYLKHGGFRATSALKEKGAGEEVARLRQNVPDRFC